MAKSSISETENCVSGSKSSGLAIARVAGSGREDGGPPRAVPAKGRGAALSLQPVDLPEFDVFQHRMLGLTSRRVLGHPRCMHVADDRT
jgi:hypothetical protein